MALVLGLNSGSSFDGIDAVVVEINKGKDGYPSRPVFKGGNSYPWPKEVAEQVLRAFENQLSIFELCRLNYITGAVYAESARSLMRDMGIKPGELEVIGYDGQTIYQEPPDHARLKDFTNDEHLEGGKDSGKKHTDRPITSPLARRKSSVALPRAPAFDRG